MLLKHYAKWIDDTDAGREASKLNSLFGEFSQILATEREIPLKYNELMVTAFAHVSNFFKLQTVESRKIVERYRATFLNAA